MVQVAELRDRRLAQLVRDEVAAEVGQLRQRGLILILDVGEYRPHPGRYLVVLTEFLRKRIDPGAVFFHRKVEMRSGRKAGRTDVSNQLPHMNVASRLHVGTNLREVTVDADHLTLMLDADAVTELAAPSRAYNSAVSDGFDRLAVLGDQVDADVRAVLVQNRVIAMERETGRYVLEVERELQRLRAERAALFII